MGLNFTRRHAAVFAVTIARYALGLGMLPYGLSKLERLQFQVPAWTYAQPLGQVSGRSLLWATMGYSPKLQIFLGLLEFVPAILLLVRRTRRIGALLMLPVAANVWVLNMGLDLWPATKIISGALLLMNIFLILYDAPAYRRFFIELLAPQTAISSPGVRRAGQVAAFAVPLILISAFLATVERQIHRTQASLGPFIGNRQINRSGTWQITRLSRGGQMVELTPQQSILYFNFDSRVMMASVDHPVTARYRVEPKAETVLIENLPLAGSSSPISVRYQSSGTTLTLVGTRDDAPIELTLQQLGWGPQ